MFLYAVYKEGSKNVWHPHDLFSRTWDSTPSDLPQNLFPWLETPAWESVVHGQPRNSCWPQQALHRSSWMSKLTFYSPSYKSLNISTRHDWQVTKLQLPSYRWEHQSLSWLTVWDQNPAYQIPSPVFFLTHHLLFLKSPWEQNSGRIKSTGGNPHNKMYMSSEPSYVTLISLCLTFLIWKMLLITLTSQYC